MNTRLIALLGSVLIIAHTASPQSYFYNNRYYDKDLLYELNVSAGGMNCLTDLGGRSGPGKGFIKDLNIGHTRLTAGFGAGLIYRYKTGIRLDLNAGTLYANDNILKDDASEARMRYLRNLHFRSTVLELLVITEWFPLAMLFTAGHEGAPRFAPYMMGGVGLFYFNPQANLNGIWIDLRPLRTEGQGFHEYPDRKPYTLTQVNFPVGIGLKYELSALFNLKLEILHRITTTDYLDDVSTTYIHPALFGNYLDAPGAGLAAALYDRRAGLNVQYTAAPGAIRGSSKRNDAYFSVMLKLSLVIGRTRR